MCIRDSSLSMSHDALKTTIIIYLDADACPVKDLVYKVAARYGVPLKVVANTSIRITPNAGHDAEMVVVPGSPDAADDWIAERAVKGDLVLTSDIPLAARVIGNDVRCLDFRGGEYNPNLSLIHISEPTRPY